MNPRHRNPAHRHGPALLSPHAALLCLLCGVAVAHAVAQAAAAPAPSLSVDGSAAETESVSPGINDVYDDPAMDVEFWDQVFTDERREVFRARHQVIDAIKPYPGDRIADVGASTGLYTKLFAEAVGSTGQVYAVDIEPAFLAFIADTAADAGLGNVTTVLGDDRSTKLPDGAVDVIFHADSYHHFEFPKTLTRDMARALVRGGELYVLDFERIPGVSDPQRLRHVRAGKATVIEEIEAAGFSFVQEIELPALEENYLLRFRKR